MLTQKDKIKNALIRARMTGTWVSGRHLNEIANRFSARLYDLSQEGFEVEKRLDPNRPKGTHYYQYRQKGE